MFLILGTPECKYCDKAKSLLDANNLKYTYVDMSLELGDGWRSIFVTLKSILGKQKSIPIVFIQNGTNPEGNPPNKISVESLELFGWKLIGSYFDLEDFLDDEVSLTDDY